MKKFLWMQFSLFMVLTAMIFGASSGNELVYGGGNDNGAIDTSKWHGEGMSYQGDVHTLVDNGITYLGGVPLDGGKGGIYQAISTQVGKTYKVTATLIGANHYKPNELHDFTLGSSYVTVDASKPTPTSTPLTSTALVTGNTPQTVETTFTATSATSYVSLRGDTGYRYPKASRISVKEVTSVNVDKIDSISGPSTIHPGEVITVNIDYATGDKDMVFTLQGSKDPWEGHIVRRFHSNEDGRSVTFTVPNDIPEGTPLMYQAILTKKGKGWSDRVAVKYQVGVTYVNLPTSKFIFGVNVGGDAVNIDGNQWLSDAQAIQEGFIYVNPKYHTTTEVTPNPVVDTDTDTMLNSVRWTPQNWGIQKKMANGTYTVAVWIMENYKDYAKSINLSVENQTQKNIGSLKKGQWKKYTYSNVQVNDGKLDITLQGKGDVHMMGFAVFGSGIIIPDTTPPVITLNGANPQTIPVGTSYQELGASATDDVDGDISNRVKIDASEVNTNTAGTYTVRYSVSDAAGHEATATRDVIVDTVTPPIGDKKPWEYGALRVSNDKHMLQNGNHGFFWMGDTAWHLARNYILPAGDLALTAGSGKSLSTADINSYLENRVAKGFSVIQISAVQDGDWLTNSSVSYAPFVTIGKKGQWGKLKEAYWKKVDYVIEEARKLGLYVALLPAWNMNLAGDGLVTRDKATAYGKAIANRYKNKKNIIWVVGGDSSRDSSKSDTGWTRKVEIWNALGQAIQNVVGQSQLMTYHGGGDIVWPEKNLGNGWLDFYMIQSGHSKDQSAANKYLKDLYTANLGKPVIDAEPRYEGIHAQFNASHPVYEAKDVRETEYRQLFSGAFGVTYGNQAIWQFWMHGNIFESGEPIKEWQDALNDPGAQQITYVAKLMKSRPILGRVPNQSLIGSGNAIATKGNGYAMVYLPKGGSVTVNLSKIASNVKAWWYNPRTGDATPIDTYNNKNTQMFDTSDTQDMVLVLDDTSRGFGTPGQ